MANQYESCNHCGERHKQCEPMEVQKEGLEFEEIPFKKQKMYIPFRLDGMNEVIGKARTHWSKSSKHKAEQQDMVWLGIRQSKLNPITRPFKMDILYVERNDKRDPDNISSAKKFILDALQEAEIIKNDSQKEVLGWTEAWQVATKEKPEGVYITFIEE